MGCCLPRDKGTAEGTSILNGPQIKAGITAVSDQIKGRSPYFLQRFFSHLIVHQQSCRNLLSVLRCITCWDCFALMFKCISTSSKYPNQLNMQALLPQERLGRCLIILLFVSLSYFAERNGELNGRAGQVLVNPIYIAQVSVLESPSWMAGERIAEASALI